MPEAVRPQGWRRAVVIEDQYRCLAPTYLEWTDYESPVSRTDRIGDTALDGGNDLLGDPGSLEMGRGPVLGGGQVAGIAHNIDAVGPAHRQGTRIGGYPSPAVAETGRHDDGSAAVGRNTHGKIKWHLLAGVGDEHVPVDPLEVEAHPGLDAASPEVPIDHVGHRCDRKYPIER